MWKYSYRYNFMEFTELLGLLMIIIAPELVFPDPSSIIAMIMNEPQVVVANR